MADLIYRTEDIQGEDILGLFVETKQDREIIEAIKGTSPIILVGSRGVGKSFLLRVAEEEMLKDFSEKKVLPVYLTFTKSSLVYGNDPRQFLNWMLARLCVRTIRALRTQGFLATPPSAISVLAAGQYSNDTILKIETIAEQYENSWQNPNTVVDNDGLPTVERFIDALEEICTGLGIRRFNFLIDEAAHIFRPEQQRQFFTLFRDLRTAYTSCNAAVYPGVTSYGDSFQPIHDATFMTVDRNILQEDYVVKMREIVEKQAEADSDLLSNISKNGQNFSLLAYAASGNPRILLKTVSRAPKINAKEINEIIREYYRTELWAEHSAMREKYPGNTVLIDWGRNFIESEVLPELQRKNNQYLTSHRSTCFFWIHRDAPRAVKEALRLLSYTGIVTENSQGIKATRGEIGTRYIVNLGCLFALESAPASSAFPIAKGLDLRRMSEYGMNHSLYEELLKAMPTFQEADMSEVLKRELDKSIDVLDLSDWQNETLKEINIKSIRDVLCSDEDKLKEAYYVGEKRARRIKSAAMAAVYEYLNG